MSRFQNTRNMADFLNEGKSYARETEAKRRLELCAEMGGMENEILDYIIWKTPGGRFVPVWLMGDRHSAFMLDAIAHGVVAFRR